ncbi:MAG: anaerobic benzoate catabolism transcriptional regulator [Pelotomaculum sp. PtaU1.Bin065]|nr:MAG: anaerobic benzoate catabolism transcriptional regulator [Pelotomaculum sp. PtaU1.Bin065]
MNELGVRLKFFREQRNMSLRALAKMAHVSHSFIKDIESGRSNPSLDTALALAKALNITLADLTDEKKVNEPTVEDQVLSASNIGEALKMAFNMYSEEKIDDITFYKLVNLAKEKFGLPSVETDEAASQEKDIPGSGILGDDEDDKNNSGNAKKHGKDIRHKDNLRKSSTKITRES